MFDQFEAFAVQCGLHVECEPLYSAPRDVLQPPSESDQYSVVVLRRPAGVAPVRLVYATPLTDADTPGISEVLWWLAGDAWTLEHAGNVLEPWAAHHGYPPAEPATRRLFESHVRQATALAALLGRSNYRRLLTLYGSQVSQGHGR